MFATLHPMFGSPVQSYGQGVMVYRLQAADPNVTDVWLGHSGGMPGAKAIVAYSREKQAFVAVALTGEGNVEAFALALVQALE